MPLATIVGMCLLLPWAQGAVEPSIAAMIVSQPQDKPAANSSRENPASPSQSNQQKAPDQSTAAQQPPAATAHPCPESSGSGSQPKSDCKSPQPAVTKAKKPRARSTMTTEGASGTDTQKTPSGTVPQKRVVPDGGRDDSQPDMSSAVSPEQASHQAESTKQLLASSDANLKKISGRKLTASEQATVEQVQSYMDQANAATKEGDVQRAYNLAVKANLLSAELAKH